MPGDYAKATHYRRCYSSSQLIHYTNWLNWRQVEACYIRFSLNQLIYVAPCTRTLRHQTWNRSEQQLFYLIALTRIRTRDLWLWYHIEFHAPTSSTQKLKLMGRGGQFTYIPTSSYLKLCESFQTIILLKTVLLKHIYLRLNTNPSTSSKSQLPTFQTVNTNATILVLMWIVMIHVCSMLLYYHCCLFSHEKECCF